MSHPASMAVSAPAFLDNEKPKHGRYLLLLVLLLALSLVAYLLFSMVEQDPLQTVTTASERRSAIAQTTRPVTTRFTHTKPAINTKRQAIALYEQAIEQKARSNIDSLYKNVNAQSRDSEQGIVTANPAPVPQKVSTPAAVVAEPEVLIPSIYDLDRFVKKNIPSISYGAHIYASDNKSGFVILNGARRRIGDQLANGIYIEKIAEEDVVLSYEGTLFTLPAMKSWSGEQ